MPELLICRKCHNPISPNRPMDEHRNDVKWVTFTPAYIEGFSGYMGFNFNCTCRIDLDGNPDA